MIKFFSPTTENGYLSNWYSCKFTDNINYYNNTEQYMMYMKAILFGDKEIATKILISKNPKEIKALGRQVKNFRDDIWNMYKELVMIDGLRLKFNQNQDLLNLLLSTGDELLVEASPYDKIWGIGLAADNPDSNDITKWRGQNLLGYSLMKVRYYLKQQNGVR